MITLPRPSGVDLNTFRLSSLSPSDLHTAIKELKKIELHCHLEGALTPEMLVALSRRHGFPLPTDDVEALRPLVSVTTEDKSLLDFLKKFDVLGGIFVSREAIEDITYEAIRGAAADSVALLELRFAPHYISISGGVPLTDVIEAVLDGRDRACAHGDISVALIAIAERQRGAETALEVLNAVTPFLSRGIVGFDLANDEYNYPPAPYGSVFLEARQRGFSTTVHAGEAAGPESVRSAIEDCGAQRIGHATRACEDPEVVAILRDRKIPVEACLTSNRDTGAIATLDAHPLRSYMRDGLVVALCTDDPGVSGIDLTSEFVTAARVFDLDMEDMYRLTEHALSAAFLSPQERDVLAPSFIASLEALRSRL